jgi:hypothetical protein
MPSEGFEPTVSSVERPQNYALDRAVVGIGMFFVQTAIFLFTCLFVVQVAVYVVYVRDILDLYLSQLRFPGI